MQRVEAIEQLFAGANPEYSVELRAIPGGSTLIKPSKIAEALAVDPEQARDWYFGVCLRATRGSMACGTFAWADVEAPKVRGEKVAIGQDAIAGVPTPSVSTSSGTGIHLYWVLNKEQDPATVVRLSKLAAAALQSDLAVCESARVMRLPGSLNHKYDPPRPCEVLTLGGPSYGIEDLEERLVAAVAASVYEEGTRHHIALALAALLARAEWPEERVVRAIRILCDITHDSEVGDRLVAVTATLRRREGGEPISAAALRDALGKVYYKPFIEGLGITARDGAITLDGEEVARAASIERDMVAYVTASGEWGWVDGVLAKWTGKHWQTYPKEALAGWVFGALGRCILTVNGDEQPLEATAKLAKAITDMAVGQLMIHPLPPTPDNLLPLENGVLDMDTLILGKHSRESGARWVLPLEYDPGAGYPAFDAYLNFVLPNERNFLQEWAGYLLVPGNNWQMMLWVYGQSGTGKSTFLNVVDALLGPACVAIRTDNLNDYTVAQVGPARAAVCSEMGSKQLRTAIVKALVSGDAMPARHPYGRPFTARFRGKLIWSSNVLPAVDQAEGLWRRLAVIPFNNKPEVPDVLIDQKLRAELPGILNWAIEGLRRVREYEKTGHWEMPKPVTEIIEEYRQAADPYSQFIEDEMDVDGEGEMASRDLYNRYKNWAQERGMTPDPFGPIFWREMRKRGLEPVMSPRRVGGRLVRVWRGGSLHPEAFMGG